jgi:hypothetical protein
MKLGGARASGEIPSSFAASALAGDTIIIKTSAPSTRLDPTKLFRSISATYRKVFPSGWNHVRTTLQQATGVDLRAR